MRKILNLNNNWKFTKDLNSVQWENVNIPHTWNSVDGYSGNEYYKGACWYEKELTVERLENGKRAYIEFNAVNSISDVYFNNVHLGEHKGGYSIFRYDVTDLIKFDEKNILKVKADNTVVDDVYPLMADFTFYGGIYRDVNLVITENIHFDLMDHGSTGVYISQDKVTKEAASLTIKAKVVSHLDEDCPVRVVADILDAEGKIVKYTAKDFMINEDAEVTLPVTIENPTLWDGVENPYLYNVNVRIEKHNDVIDELNIPTGLRFFEFDAKKGFFLNGKHMKLQGVSRHQDKYGKGWALTKEDHDLDMQLIKEVGANSIRLAHYQHDQYFYDLCDREGMIIWAEIPFISRASETDLTGKNAKSQMIELIRQNFNHSSIVMWGVENEIQIGGDLPYVRQIVKDLNDICHREDPTRLTTQANVMSVPNDDEYNTYTDIIAYNKYYGWYTGKTEDFADWLDDYHATNPNTALGVSEYGCEGIITYHTDEPKVKDYTEEYHALYHETLLKIFNERDFLWGSYVWNFFDFGSAIRDEGGVKGRNNKGLITFDRKLKKDGFYAYKAVWSKEPFVHITSKRFLDRPTDNINIKVYSNCDEVTLFVNGEKVNTLTGEHTFVFENVQLSEGATDVRVIATKAGKEYTDYAFFNKVTEANPVYECPEQGGGFAANWFDEDLISQYTDIEITELDITDDVYSTATSIADILDHEEAAKILRKYCPNLVDSPMISMISKGNLDDLNKQFDLGIDERLLFLLNKELIQIEKIG